MTPTQTRAHPLKHAERVVDGGLCRPSEPRRGGRCQLRVRRGRVGYAGGGARGDGRRDEGQAVLVVVIHCVLLLELMLELLASVQRGQRDRERALLARVRVCIRLCELE